MDLRANTAVDVLIGPFVDSTDGNTTEDGLTISQADVKLSKNGQSLAQKNDNTACAFDDDGYYNCELDATDTNTEGNLVLIVHESGALPVRHEFNVLAEAAWDSLYVAKDDGFMDVNIKTIGRADTQETEANNLESACSNYSATRGLTGTALPAAAADAAGGLPISDTGGLDLDAKLANTNEITVARMGALTDWINGGRLDLILDIIAADVVNIDGDAMRGTDGANTTVPDAAGVAPTAIEIRQEIDANSTRLDANVSSRSSLSAADVKSEVDDALTDIHLDHLLAVDYDPASKPGVATALLNELIENDGGVSRYTENALEQAPSGTGGDATEAKQDTIITHLTEVKGTGFVEGTDSNEAIRNRGDAAWGGSAASFVGLQGGLNLNFRINESSGRYIYDKLHAGFKGILDEDITFVEGVKGKALNFSGGESVECRSWWNESKYSENPVVAGQGGQKGAYFPNLIDVGDEIWMYYSIIGTDADIRTGLSKSTDGGKTFVYFGIVLDTSASDWDSKRAHDVCVIEDGGTYKMWYAGSDDDITGEIGYATSPDGEVWTKQGIVFEKGAASDFDEAGVTYMTVLKESGTYYMWYSGYNDSMTYGGMGLATSADGVTWTRYQTTPVLAGANYFKGVVKKYGDVYYMLFSNTQAGAYLYVAYSTDRINWTVNNNPIIEKSLTSTDWDGEYIIDAGWYSLDGTEAKIYYCAAKTVGVDDSLGLITIPDVALKAQQSSVVNQYPISISCWVKTTDSGASRGIVSLGPTSGPHNGFALYVNSGRLKALYAVDGSDYVNMTPDVDDGGIINDGLWHHIIFTVDSGGGELFVDLVSQNTVAWTGTPGVSDTLLFMKIGEYANKITGQIDEIRIYDHALSSDERRGISIGLPYLEDNTLEIIIDQETTNDEIAELQGVNFDTTTDSNEAIRDELDSTQLTGSNAITINIKDQNTNNVVECIVEIWDSANTTFYESKTTNSFGNTSHNMDDGTYIVRIRKAGYSFTNQTLVVTTAETKNYTGTLLVADILTPVPVDACRVYEYAFMPDGETPVASIHATARIVSLPEDLNGILHVGIENESIYDSSTGILYWDIVKGAEVEFTISSFGVKYTRVIPDQTTARLSDIS